jgi:serine/threonine protein kinase
MAPELLNISERLPSADIFSLGLSVYELCYTVEQIEKGNLLLPTEGPLWHQLREGASDPVQNRPMEMVQLIQNMLLPDPASRPTAEMIVSIPEVAAMQDDEDPALLNAPEITFAGQSVPPLGLQRPHAFHSLFRTGSISDLENQAYIQELLARATTPH